MAIQDHDSRCRECGESKTNRLPKLLSLYIQGSSSCLPWLMDGSIVQAPPHTLPSFPLIFHTVLSFPLLPGLPLAEAALAKKLMKALTVPGGVNRIAGPQRPATLTFHACLWFWVFLYKLNEGSGKLISRKVPWCAWHRSARRAWGCSPSCLSAALCFPAGGWLD